MFFYSFRALQLVIYINYPTKSILHGLLAVHFCVQHVAQIMRCVLHKTTWYIPCWWNCKVRNMKDFHCFNIIYMHQWLIMCNLLADFCRLLIVTHVDDFRIILLVDNIPLYISCFSSTSCVIWSAFSIYNSLPASTQYTDLRFLARWRSRCTVGQECMWGIKI